MMNFRKPLTQIEADDSFLFYCRQSLNSLHIHAAQYYLVESSIKASEKTLGIALSMASLHSNYDFAAYLLSSPELTYKPDIHQHDDELLINACLQGATEFVRYFCNSKDVVPIPKFLDKLTEHANPVIKENKAVINAIKSGKVELVVYLLRSSDLKYNPPLIGMSGNGFITAVEQYKQANNILTLEYLIYDYNVPYSEDIRKYLDIEQLPEIKYMFEKRMLSERLSDELNISTKIIQKNKL